MPCGGIYPIEVWFGLLYDCFHCGKSIPPASYAVEEWDAFLHRDCILPFLATVEGQIVVEHRHEIIIGGDEDGVFALDRLPPRSV